MIALAFAFAFALLAAPVIADPLDDARALHIAGEWREALLAYTEVTASGEASAAAVAYNNSCVILNRLADYPAALAACRRALELRRELGDERRLGRTLNNLGLALQRLGRAGEAEAAYREALAINEQLGDVEAQLINLQNLGLTATEAGRYGEALALFDAAEALADGYEDEGRAAYQARLARLNRGVVLERIGAYREALDIYLRLTEERELLDDAHWASLQVNLGVVYRNLGDPVRAVAAYEATAEAYERLGDTAALSNAILNLALAWHLNLERPDDAEAAYRQALELARASGDRAEEIQDLFYLGSLLLETGRLDEAEAAFEECLAASEAAESTEGHWSAVYGLGRVAEERGRRREALRRFEGAISKIETVRAGLAGGELRAGYFGDKRPVYASAVRTLAGLEAEEPGGGHARRALEVVQRTKARELLESLGDVEGRAPTAPLSASDLAAFDGDGVRIEYFAGRDALYRWTIDRGEIRMDDLGPAAPILSRTLEVHRRLSSGGAPDGDTLDALAKSLFSGLEKRLAGATRVWIAPDGALHYLPFEVLPLSDAGKSAVEAIEIAYLPSASALASLGAGLAPTGWTPAERSLAGFGGPELRAAGTGSLSGRFAARFGLLPLPAAARELISAAELLGGESTIATGARATEAALRQAAADGARVLHLATHAVVDERPGQGAAILLTPDDRDDGLLRPAEIASLDLRSDLTVLAACRSALGGAEDGRAFASLTGSFLAAGSSAVLASLWDVGDEASAAFMAQLYYQLGRGQRPAAALRRAKLRLRADPAWDRPHLWAAFILIGDAPAVTPRRGPAPWVWITIAMAVAIGAWRIGRAFRRPG